MSLAHKITILCFGFSSITATLSFAQKSKDSVLIKKSRVNLTKELENVSVDDLNALIRQKPNARFLGIPFRLIAYRMVDVDKVKAKRQRLDSLNLAQNKEIIARVERINARRISRAIKKNDSTYRKKYPDLYDPDNARKFFREWLKYSYGEAPVYYRPELSDKNKMQFSILLKKKGYQNPVITLDSLLVKKGCFYYKVDPGDPILIDSVVLKGSGVLISNFNWFEKNHIKNTGTPFFKKHVLDADYLEAKRYEIIQMFKDAGIYGVNTTNMIYYAKLKSANNPTEKVNYLIIDFEPRKIAHPTEKDSLITVPFKTYKIQNVYFHLSDSLYVSGDFASYVKENTGKELVPGITRRMYISDPMDKTFITTVKDTLYQKILCDEKIIKEYASKGIVYTEKDPSPRRQATFYYNGSTLFLRPQLLELQNFLEADNTYKDKYLSRSLSYFNELGVFSNVKAVFKDYPTQGKADVHYFLSPAKKQSFSLEPKFTSSFGLLGVNASLNYTNNNLFRGAEQLTFSLGGGFESQPLVFDNANQSGRIFNTIEIGPSLKLRIPGFLPIPLTKIQKRNKAYTLLTLQSNFEKRDIFTRWVVQFNYNWQFKVYSDHYDQFYTLGLPFMSVIKFVDIQKSPSFESQITSLNDLFLKNTYSSQFIWEDFKIQLQLSDKVGVVRETSKDKLDKGLNRYFKPLDFDKVDVQVLTSVSLAGNTLRLLTLNQSLAPGETYSIFGNSFAQFVKNDNLITLKRKLNGTHFLVSRLMAGVGIPYGNSKTSMPYDYSFFAGGANDNRGWKARTLGPGIYKAYLDSTGTATQVGDIRMAANLEYRFPLSKSLLSCLFIDMGNIWTFRKDENRPGAEFTKSWIRQLGITAGTGIRYDLDFFIVRLDFGFPLHNPALPDGAGWVFQNRKNYYLEGATYYGFTGTESEKIALAKGKLPRPFVPAINFGIGLPF